MQAVGERAISGHVFRVEGKRRPVWRAKYRLPDGRQVQRTIGPAWTARGRPAAGFFTKRTAEAWLSSVLSAARAGTLPGMVRTGVTFAEACEEYLRWLEQDRDRKPSTVRDYGSVIRAHLLPAFGSRPIEDISDDDIERWKIGLGVESGMSNATKLKILTILSGVFERARKVHKLPRNPMAAVEKPIQRVRGDIDVFSVEEVMALVRAAADEQDAAIYLTAALTGLRRGELVALRWRDVDFAGQSIRVRASYTEGGLTTPKSGKVRAVPMAPQVSSALARLATRDAYSGNDDLVFPGTGGGYLDASALYRRYKRALEIAGLRPLRFHDLRHTFGTRTIATASILQVKAWMGHADVATTMKYLHYAPRAAEARLVAEAFALAEPGAEAAPESVEAVAAAER
jgi:integrase